VDVSTLNTAAAGRKKLGLAAGATADAGTATDVQGLGARAAGASGRYADAAHVHPAPEWTPADQGLLAWNYDPSAAGTTWNATSGTNGYLFLTAMLLRVPATLTAVRYGLSGAQTSGLTVGENLIGLYDASGNLLAQTADLTALWSSTANQKVLTSNWTAPYAAAAGTYYVAWLYNGVSSGLNFKGSGAGTTANAGASAGSMRYSMVSGSYTALPNPINLSNQATPVPFNNQWVGLL
jgi:hypothetical protein